MTDKEKIKLWCKGRLFELMNGVGENNAKEVLKDLLDFIDADPSVESTAPNSELSNLETTGKDCKETPTNEEFKVFAQKYLNENDGEILNVYDRYVGLVDGANWKEQQMITSAKLHGWVARDENDSLHLFEVEPSRIEDRGQWWDRDYNCTTLDKNDFPDLKWEDEPVYVKLIVIEEE